MVFFYMYASLGLTIINILTIYYIESDFEKREKKK